MTDSKRPSYHDECVNRAAGEALLPRVLEWLRYNGDQKHSEEERKVILDQLVGALDLQDDGYDIARALDSNHTWDVDSELVDILEDATFEKLRAHEKAVEAWVQQHGVAPKYSVGQRVAFKRQRWDKEPVTGEITAVREKTAQYLVFCESLGHVRTGCGTHGTYVAYEDAEAA